MKIITITGFKGGVGKSTTAVHLAGFLATKGNVLLIDGDPNRTAITWNARGGLPFDTVDERQAPRLIPGRDWIVIDTPARPNSDDLRELAKGCDLLILPTVPDIASLGPMIQTAKQLGDARYCALITMASPPPNRDGEIMQAEMQEMSIPVFGAIIRRSISFSKATNAGVLLRDLKGRDRIPWRDYENLGNEVLRMLGE